MAPITPAHHEAGAEQRPTPILPPVLRHTPTLRLHLEDLTSPATTAFIKSINTAHLIPDALRHIIKQLYTPHGAKHIPAVRSVTIVLRQMGGVAYTTGLPLDDLHKEIHLSLSYLSSRLPPSSSPSSSSSSTSSTTLMTQTSLPPTNLTNSIPPTFPHEIHGVLLHELVHCYQHNSHGTAPGGLIEGIADFVRLKAGLAPAHWRKGSTEKEMGTRWDEGYQKTAWFLEWLEKEKGRGCVGRMNERMGEGVYVEGGGEGKDGGREGFWEGLFGESVLVLWGRYKDTWGGNEVEVQAGKDTGTGGTEEQSEVEVLGEVQAEHDESLSRDDTEAEMVDLTLEEKEALADEEQGGAAGQGQGQGQKGRVSLDR